jgi:tRNA (guanine37-N1)-methyltransferase
MQIDIVSLFPEMFSGPFNHSIIKRAQDSGRLAIHVINPRDFTTDKHHIVDDYPFGGGSGMVMKPEPLFKAVEHVLATSPAVSRRVILMCPSGSQFNQEKAKQLAKYEQLVFVCGHYEGIDDRVRQHLVDEAVSIGDFVLTGGELAAMVIVDAVSRMLPGVLGAADGAQYDSFYSGLLEYPQYTRPREFRGWNVPDILLSGDHAKIDKWRRFQSLKKTLEYRPDLLDSKELSPEDAKIVAEIRNEKSGG